MDIIKIAFVFILFWINKASGDCTEVRVAGATGHPYIDGEYELFGRCGHLQGSLVYKKKDPSKQPMYLYYHEGTGWKGWIFSNTTCSSVALVRLPSNKSDSPELLDNSQNHAEELINNGYRANRDITIECLSTSKSKFTDGIIVLLSLLCATFVVLLAMAPLLWIRHAQQRKRTDNQPTSTQLRETLEMSVITEPPPYTPIAMPIATIATAPCQSSYQADNTMPGYPQTMSYSASPPRYEEHTNVQPPSYEYSVENSCQGDGYQGETPANQEYTCQNESSQYV